MLFGAHISTEGGLATAFGRADDSACDVFQIFTKNRGAWAARPLTNDDVRAFRLAARAARSKVAVAHAAYLINIASPAREIRARSIDALQIEVERCEALGIPLLVLHPGSHSGTSEADGLRRVVSALDEVHRATRGFRTKVLLETAAGQGSSVGSRFAAIGAILGAVKRPERLGVCLDTCHLFAAGYEIHTREGYETAMDELEREVGRAAVLCIHINDSKKDLGSRVDRHEHLGRGQIGRAGLAIMVNDPRFREVPFIFELPPENDMIRGNLKVLRRLARPVRPGRPTS